MADKKEVLRTSRIINVTMVNQTATPDVYMKFEKDEAREDMGKFLYDKLIEHGVACKIVVKEETLPAERPGIPFDALIEFRITVWLEEELKT